MYSSRSLLAKLVIACAFVLACAVPVFAATQSTSNDNGTGGATSVSVPKPDGLAENDFMLAAIAMKTGSSVTPTPPDAGWNLIVKRTNTQNDDTTLATYWKVATATDVSATNFVWTALPAGTVAYGGISRYDDVAGEAPVFQENPDDDGNLGASASLTAPSVTTLYPGSYVVGVWEFGVDQTLTVPGTMTQLFNRGNTGGRLAAADVSQATAGVSGTKIATAGGSVRYVAQTLALKPKPTRLGYSTSEQTGGVDGCIGPITVQTRNSSNHAVRPLSATEVTLASDDPDSTGSFYSDGGCSSGLTQTDRTVGTGATGFSFYYKPLARGNGSHTITATATGLQQATQAQTVKLGQAINWPDILPTSETYGESFEVGPATASPSGLTVTITASGGGCDLNGSLATITSATSDCTLTATQTGDADYAAATPIARTVQTDPRPITVTADPDQSKVYDNGQSNPTYEYSVTSGDLVGTDVLSGALTRAVGETVAGSPYTINQGTLSASSNYAFTYVSDTFAITPRPLSINAQAKSKTYGDSPDPNLTATLSNLAQGDNRNDADIDGDESCTRTPGETVPDSPYTITCTQGTLTANANYSFVTGTTAAFTINQRQLSLDAVPASRTYGDADPDFTAAPLSGFVLGDTDAVVAGAPVCTTTVVSDADAAVYPGAITCAAGTLTADNYSFAPGAAADLEITQRTANATFTVADKVYNRTTAATVTGQALANRASFDDAADVELIGAPGAATFGDANAEDNKTVTVDPGTLALDPTGLEVANYTLAIDTATADINPKPVDGSFTAAGKVYNGITAATVTSRSVDSADVISPDVVTLVGGAANFANPNAGNGKTVTLTGASVSNANYTVGAVATDTANITKRDVTGSFTAADKNYDGTAAATITGRSLSNAVPGDAVALTGGTATFDNPNPGADKPVRGTGFALGGADAPNYNLTGVAATTASISRQPAGNTPPPKNVEKDAADALGGPVKELTGLDLAGLGFAFAPEGQKGTLKVGKKALKLFAIGGCDAPCTVNAKKTIVLTTAGASAAGTKKLKLKAQNLTLAAGEFGVVKLKKLSRKQRKAIRKAEKAKLVVKVTLTAGAEQANSKKKYRLKLKQG